MLSDFRQRSACPFSRVSLGPLQGLLNAQRLTATRINAVPECHKRDLFNICHCVSTKATSGVYRPSVESRITCLISWIVSTASLSSENRAYILSPNATEAQMSTRRSTADFFIELSPR